MENKVVIRSIGMYSPEAPIRDRVLPGHAAVSVTAALPVGYADPVTSATQSPNGS